MTRTIGIGVIGMGWMGTVHSRSYRQIPIRFQDCDIQPRLVICADEVEARAREAQTFLGFERYATDWRQVIADPEVELVNITAPNNMHLEIASAAAEAGKHIFCEKACWSKSTRDHRYRRCSSTGWRFDLCGL